jgi:two-component sensor histidine kinase/putative methionine-R-sulfoxide reductase with GAF domain
MDTTSSESTAQMETALDGYAADVKRLLRQQAALATFGSFAFRETDLLKILNEAARICAGCLDVPFCKVCRYRPTQNDLLIEAGCGRDSNVIGRVVSPADASSPQGRAYITGKPVIIRNLNSTNDLSLPAFYRQHEIVATVDVLIKGIEGPPYGVLEVDSPTPHAYDEHDISFLTGFANVLAEAVATQTRMQALRKLVEVNNVLARELKHRVRNNLQLILAMLDRHAATLDDGPPKQGIETISLRLMTMARMYDSLLGSGLASTVDLGAYVRQLCADLTDVHGAEHRDVRQTCSTVPLQVDLDTVTALGMAAAELVTNCYVHGFPNGKSGTIDVLLSTSESGEGVLTIKDNGVGFDVTAENKRHGVGLVKQLMRQVNGSFDIQSDDGTQWILRFPIHKAI